MVLAQEPLSSLAAEYQAGSPILLEKIKVAFLSMSLCFFFLLLLLLCSFFFSKLTCFLFFFHTCRYWTINTLQSGEQEAMGIASSEVLCSLTLYVLRMLSSVMSSWFLLFSYCFWNLFLCFRFICRSIFWNHKIVLKSIVSRSMLRNVERVCRTWVIQILHLRTSLR